MTDRTAKIARDTLETQITVEINLDGSGKSEFNTGVPFLDHMLDQVARHGMVDLNIQAKGDLLTLGQAFDKAVGLVLLSTFPGALGLKCR